MIINEREGKFQMKQQITEEMNLHEQWYKEAKKQTLETLPAFFNKLVNDYCHDYGTICHALSASAIAAATAMNKSPAGGITGFQAGCVMWGFVRHWNHDGNKCGLSLKDWDNVLYPQYKDDFEKIIPGDVWVAIQKEARKNLDTVSGARPAVVAHWQSIVDGIVPFGYRVGGE